MTKFRVSTTIRYLLFSVMVLAPNLWAQERPPILEKVAKTYGLDSWNQIEAVRYSFHIEFGAFNLERSWEWEPKTTKVCWQRGEAIKRQGLCSSQRIAAAAPTASRYEFSFRTCQSR